MSDRDKIDLFKSILGEYMLKKSDDLESDRSAVLNRISLYDLDPDRYYDLIVIHIRNDTYRTVFRDILFMINSYL